MSEKLQQWTVTEPYLDLHCDLGEGPHYEPATNHLRFVDIKSKRLHTVDLSAGPESLKTIQFDIPVGVTVDIEGVDPTKKILLGGKSGVYLLDRETEKVELLKGYQDNAEAGERLRGNDGAVDPAGRFWIGTMNDFWVGEPQPEGSLFHFASDLTRTTVREGLIIPNSIGWSLDNQTLYFTHSTERLIRAFDYDRATGAITNERPFYQHAGPGEPDGFRVDVEGNLWSAVYGEGKVLKISPAGKLMGEISYPAKCMTCPAFVGTELWATSAEGDGSDKYGGGLFRVDVGVKGKDAFRVKLDEGVVKL